MVLPLPSMAVPFFLSAATRSANVISPASKQAGTQAFMYVIHSVVQGFCNALPSCTQHRWPAPHANIQRSIFKMSIQTFHSQIIKSKRFLLRQAWPNVLGRGRMKSILCKKFITFRNSSTSPICLDEGVQGLCSRQKLLMLGHAQNESCSRRG